MKKTLFTFALITLFSCKKEVISTQQTQQALPAEECYCGVIDQTITEITDSVYYKAVIYNECSGNDTTVNYIPQTNSGYDKHIGDYHCLGVNW